MAESKTYLIVTTDPIHIGTGGYRLGRVDNAIVRDPGTNVPKLPGTTISGATRSYSAVQYGKPQCAGQGQSSVTSSWHCGRNDCAICYTFGYTRTESYSGVVSFYDAHIVFFPVFSLAGTVWVTTRELLIRYGLIIEPAEEGQSIAGDISEDMILVGEKLSTKPSLNLGWLLLKVSPPSVKIAQGVSLFSDQPGNTESLSFYDGWGEIPQDLKENIAITTPRLFSHIVNANLEIRTSVSIDPQTGTAATGALFTYEAIPRGTIMAMEIVKDDYRNAFDRIDRKNTNWTDPFHAVESGMKAIEYLGVGGMGTRGFGRFRVLCYRREESTS